MADGKVIINTQLDNEGFKSGLSKLGNVAKTGLKATGVAIAGVATAATGAIAGLLALESATEEYRIAQGKLNTAFEAAGYGPETAAQAYNEFYSILGDTDTATEASQLLSKLAQSEEDVSKWTNIAAGVYGTFGDALPIEGLIESANETAKVGQVTGTLADALNWAGISEEQFNAKLAACTSESERNQLIMDTLSGTYDEASAAFYRNNEALVQARQNQALLDETMASLGETISIVKNNLLSEFLPGINEAVNAFIGMVTGVEGSKEAFSEAISGLVQSATERLPEVLEFGTQILESLITGILESIPALTEATPQIIENIILTLTELLPDILQAGMDILLMLADGIIEAIPELVAMLPEVILAIINFITSNLPKIISAGGELLGSLITGIIGAIPELVANLPQIIMAIVQGLAGLGGSIVQAGKDIIRGLWNGISSMGDWLWNKVSGLFSSVWDGVKSFFGIESPSKKFRWIGEMIDRGMAGGIEDNINLVRNAASKLDVTELVKNRIPQLDSAVSSMAPASVSAPRFGTQRAIDSAVGAMSLAQDNASREIIMQINGREFARLMVPDIRAAESQSPAIIYG